MLKKNNSYKKDVYALLTELNQAKLNGRTEELIVTSEDNSADGILYKQLSIFKEWSSNPAVQAVTSVALMVTFELEEHWHKFINSLKPTPSHIQDFQQDALYNDMFIIRRKSDLCTLIKALCWNPSLEVKKQHNEILKFIESNLERYAAIFMVQQFAFSKTNIDDFNNKATPLYSARPELETFETILSSQNLHNLSDISYCDDPRQFQIAMDNHISDRLKKGEKIEDIFEIDNSLLNDSSDSDNDQETTVIPPSKSHKLNEYSTPFSKPYPSSKKFNFFDSNHPKKMPTTPSNLGQEYGSMFNEIINPGFFKPDEELDKQPADLLYLDDSLDIVNESNHENPSFVDCLLNSPEI